MGKQNCFLSKCRYLNGVKCLKLAWHECNNPQLIPKPDAQTQAVFNWGHFIGDKAKAYFPDGEENLEQDFERHLQVSREWLARRIPLFEVAYMSGNNLYARPDVLRPAGDNAFDIIEVKCNTKIHEINVRDIAYQRFVLEAAGLAINKLYIMHPKPDCKVTRDSLPEDIFAIEEVTERASLYLPEIAENVANIRNACAADNPPLVFTGNQCETPYKCPMFSVCYSEEAVWESFDCDTECAKWDIRDCNDHNNLLMLANRFALDNMDSVAIIALQKARSLAKYSTDYVEIGLVHFDMGLDREAAIHCLALASEKAIFPCDIEEVEMFKKTLDDNEDRKQFREVYSMNRDKFIEAVAGDDLVAVKKMIEAEIDVNLPDKSGTPALHYARSRIMVELLVACGAYPDSKDENGRTALFYCNSVEAVEAIIKAGCDVNFQDGCGSTALHTTNSGRIAEVLIANGASIEICDANQWTPLHCAANAEVAKILIENGADVAARDWNGRTPMHMARSEDIFLALLLDGGADSSAKDNSGESASVGARRCSAECQKTFEMLDGLRNKKRSKKEFVDYFINTIIPGAKKT